MPEIKLPQIKKTELNLEKVAYVAQVIGWIVLTIVSFRYAALCKIDIPTSLRVAAGIGAVLVLGGVIFGYFARPKETKA